ncbi:hypothetical protein Tco_1556365 [Tanacetum coccineum]
MVEPEKPLKKKDQIAIDEEVARNLEAQLQERRCTLELINQRQQKIAEHVEAKKMTQGGAEMKMYFEIVKDVEDIDREDLETLWKLVKAKHENIRLEEDY